MPVTNHLLRLTCGLGLLLLVALQEKVCTWPVVEVVCTDDQAIAGSPDDDSETEKPPLTLAATVPDVVAPRWPVQGRTRLVKLVASPTKASPNDTVRPPRLGSDRACARLALDEYCKTVLLRIVIVGPQQPVAVRRQFLSCVWPTAPPRA